MSNKAVMNIQRRSLGSIVLLIAGIAGLLCAVGVRADAASGVSFNKIANAPVSQDIIDKIEQACPAKAPAEPRKPRKLLVFYLCEGYVHRSIPVGNKAFEILGKKTGAYTAVLSDNMKVFNPGYLKQFDAILFNNTTRLSFKDPAQRKALMDFVKGGKGVIGIHAACDNFYTWPEAAEMIGGQFNDHPWTAGGTWAVKINDPLSPINKSFHGTGFLINDEIYQMKDPYSRSKVHELLSLNMQDAHNSKINKRRVKRTDGDFAIAWIHRFGKGRVFYCSLGHNSHIYWNKAILAHYLAGIQYALGDLKADDTPSALEHANIDGLLEKIKTYKYGQSRLNLTVVANAIRKAYGNKALLRQWEIKLGALLSQEGVSRACKNFVCRELYLIGSDATVNELGKLLTNPEMSDMARYALQCNKSRSVDRVLLSALGKTSGKVRIGIINTLGERRTAGAVSYLSKLARNGDAATVKAAVIALGKIGGDNVIRCLSGIKDSIDNSGDAALKLVWSDAYLKCADKLLKDGDNARAAEMYKQMLSAGNIISIRVAAFMGVVKAEKTKAIPMVIKAFTGNNSALQVAAMGTLASLPGSDATRELARQLPGLSVRGKIMLVNALGQRGDKAACEYIAKLANDKSLEVRLAVLNVLSKLGGADYTGIFLQGLKSDNRMEQAVALSGLEQLNGKGVDEAITKALVDERNANIKAKLIGCLGARKASSAVSIIIRMTLDNNRKVQVAALKALRGLVGPKNLPELLTLLEQVKSKSALKAAENTIIAVARSIPQPGKRADAVLKAMRGASSDKEKASFLRILAGIANTKALYTIMAYRNNGNPEIQDVVVRALVNWPDARPMSTLLGIAKNSKSDIYRILALQGYIRQIGLLGNISANERLNLYMNAMQMAKRDTEKKQILAGMSGVKSLEALLTVSLYLKDKPLKAEAEMALVDIAGNICGAWPEEVSSILQKVISQSNNKAVKKKAQVVLRAIGKFGDYVTAWEVAGPYALKGKIGADMFDVRFPPENPDAQYAHWQIMPMAIYPDKPWMVPLDAVFGGENKVVYLRSRIWSPRVQRVRMELGSDDGFKVWLNGVLVGGKSVARACEPGSDKINVNLVKGWNLLMLKITQDAGQWAACVRFVNTDGSRLVGLRSMVGMMHVVGQVESDKMMGDWQGKCVWSDGSSSNIVAQVIALGAGTYRMNMLPEFDRRVAALAVLYGYDGTCAGMGKQGVLAGSQIVCTMAGGKITGVIGGGKRNGQLSLQKVVRLSSMLGARPPAGAVVLFDGSNMDQWQSVRGGPCPWKIVEGGAMEVRPHTGSIVSKEKFVNQQIHLEFRTPFMPRYRGQGRGNSGVYVQGRYEVQVLDSYGLAGKDNECGGIYKVGAPLINMCAPPGQWQSYDITFYAPRFDAQGRKVKDAHITVIHNGVKVQDDIDVSGPTAGAQKTNPATPGPLLLQDHGCKVQYRNIWVVRLGR